MSGTLFSSVLSSNSLVLDPSLNLASYIASGTRNINGHRQVWSENPSPLVFLGILGNHQIKPAVGREIMSSLNVSHRLLSDFLPIPTSENVIFAWPWLMQPLLMGALPSNFTCVYIYIMKFNQSLTEEDTPRSASHCCKTPLLPEELRFSAAVVNTKSRPGTTRLKWMLECDRTIIVTRCDHFTNFICLV